MKEALDRFKEIVSQPYEWVKKEKEKSRRTVIGCFPMGVPEEIFHAAGMLPVVLLGSDQPISIAHKYIPQHVCSLMRSNFDMYLREELGFLDGIVFPDICDAIQRLSDVWRLHCPIPFHHNIASVVQDTPSGMSFMIEEFTRLKTVVEEFFDVNISDEVLNESIAVYNENRSFLTRLNALRRSKPGVLGARDFSAVVEAGMLMSKEEHSRLLVELLKKAENTELDTAFAARVKIVLSGNLCQHSLWPVLNLLDELGIVVVDDDLYVGTSYFAAQAKASSSPMAALAERYIKGVPSPVKINVGNEWADYLIGMVKRAKASGVIILRLMYCDYAFDYPYLRERFSQNGIPELLIETDQELDLEDIETRLESFVEIVGGD
jgi:bcr-type benzoyl-CoA reductase subunit C